MERATTSASICPHCDMAYGHAPWCSTRSEQTNEPALLQLLKEIKQELQTLNETVRNKK